ncbi:trypsin [Variibacter gotjawalensis]|uniref:Trypsin n=2 Tax=Variibacter gotjawalensis TaxID=1333996 RepID=A0A0S3PZ47_9BRAD|nr:trypsin [Variibacter gotjawalensis]BAT61228.1 trypsin [Variibacter gotjawalensis]
MRLNRRMRFALALFAFAVSLPAHAMVGNTPLATPETGSRHAVLIVGSRGNSCTGAALSRDVVLTAAHCVPPGADYKIVEYDAARRPTLKDVREIVRHPQFSLQAMQSHRATADIALLKLASPLPAAIMPATLSTAGVAQAGASFIVTGYGVTALGDGRSGGTLRSARLVATGTPGGLQLRLVDPATRNGRAGQGACTADSGGPVFAPGSLDIVGVVSWSTGPGNTAGCGGLTGVAPILRYRDWILQTLRRLGG